MSRTQRFSPVSVQAMRYAALTALLIFAAAGAAQAGVCISADIDEPILLPDGDVHDAGKLRLCLDRDYSPVASLHLAYIDNQSIGMLTSRRDQSEGMSDRPFMMFVRRSDGLLQLHSYALPAAGHMETYLLRSPAHTAAPLRVAVQPGMLTAQRIPAGAF